MPIEGSRFMQPCYTVVLAIGSEERRPLASGAPSCPIWSSAGRERDLGFRVVLVVTAVPSARKAALDMHQRLLSMKRGYKYPLPGT